MLALGGGDADDSIPPLNLAATMLLPSAPQPMAPPMQQMAAEAPAAPMQAWGEVAPAPQQQMQQQVQMQQQMQMQQMQMQQQQQQAQQMTQQMQMLTPRDAAGGHDAAHDRVLAQHAMMLGQTMDRMEETFNFQVECMREDLKKAREQLQALGAAMRR